MNLNDFCKLAFCDSADVSRETFEKLKRYHDLLGRWNAKINLVSKSTLSSAWSRHFVDSAQLWRHQDGFSNWVDIGSGAGFPGLVNAILSSELNPLARFNLVESDERKCAFLRSVAREVEVNVAIHDSRAEALPQLNADVLSARALAPLTQLFEYSRTILAPDGICLFLKGQNYDTEVSEAEKRWVFSCESFQSATDPAARILKIRDIEGV